MPRIIVLMILIIDPARLHITSDRNYLTQLQRLCDLAHTCVHDMVMICGKSVNEARSFLDLCDMYEYSCEYNMVYRHTREEEGVCPNSKELQ